MSFGAKKDWECWSEFLLLGKWKGYKKLLVGNGFTVVADKIPLLSEFERACERNSDLDKKIAKLDEPNKLAYEDLIMSIKTIPLLEK